MLLDNSTHGTWERLGWARPEHLLAGVSDDLSESVIHLLERHGTVQAHVGEKEPERAFMKQRMIPRFALAQAFQCPLLLARASGCDPSNGKERTCRQGR